MVKCSRRKHIDLLEKGLLLLCSIFVSFSLGEAVSRILIPISPGAKKMSVDGTELSIWWVKPGSIYRQISKEFDALTTINRKGHRIPSSNGNPDVIFIGDSFTFGQGISDKDTFVYKYCRDQNLECVNLGEPGTGTGQQIDRLKKFLEKEDWAPGKVILCLMVMSAHFGAGNDFADNILYAEKGDLNRVRVHDNNVAIAGGIQNIFMNGAVGFGKTMMTYSNLVRLLKFTVGPSFKAVLLPRTASEELKIALSRTAEQIGRLADLASRHGFDHHIIVFHPVQDIIRGTYGRTVQDVRSVAGSADVYGTAENLMPDPEQYYFRYDGHLNPSGAERVARMLERLLI